MDKRVKHRSRDKEKALREQLFQGVYRHQLTIAEAVKLMQQISPLTQPEFAQHRQISLQSFKQIIAGKGNPTLETLNKIASIYGLEMGFVPIKERAVGGDDKNK
jgi:DNA-binding phage protein